MPQQNWPIITGQPTKKINLCYW